MSTDNKSFTDINTKLSEEEKRVFKKALREMGSHHVFLNADEDKVEFIEAKKDPSIQ